MYAYFRLDFMGFKPSAERLTPNLQMIPTNLHIQRIHVSSSEGTDSKTYNTVTMGSPTDHLTGHKHGIGLKSIVNNLSSRYVIYLDEGGREGGREKGRNAPFS